MELINKNAVVGSLNVVKEIAQGDLHMLIAVRALLETIDEMPTIDAVPVIRCKDCIYYRPEIDMCDEPHSTAHNVVHEDDYCSRAERKEEWTE